MGAYLSSPVQDKVSEDKDAEFLSYGASSMQGWRVSQEDAHNCCPDFDPETNTALFAVYDGHGGGEVAQYTALELPKYIKGLESYKSSHLSQSLEDAFIGFDEVLTREEVIETLRELAGVNPDEPDDDEDDEEEEAAALQEEAEMPIQELLERYGSGGNAALANLRKREKFLSPVIRAKKTQQPEDADSEEVPAENDVCIKLEGKLVNGHSDNENNENIQRELSRQQESNNTVSQSDSASSTPAENLHPKTESLDEKSDSTKKPSVAEKKTADCDSTENSDIKTEVKVDSDADSGIVSSAASSSDVKSEVSTESGSTKSNQEEPSSTSSCSSAPRTESSSSGCCSSSSSAGPSSSSTTADGPAITSSSTDEVTGGTGTSSSGGSSAAPCGSSSSAGGSSIEADGPSNSTSQSEDPQPGSSTGRTRKKRTSIIPADGEDESSAESSDDYDGEEEDWGSGSSDEDDSVMYSRFSEMDEEELAGDDEDEENEDDEIMTGGEEPGSDSGCTAVVALLRGRDLFVANAGDSRCVVSRGGKAFDMSVDHKPEDEPERARIVKAGGRVTLDGRVNGGLNLSRAIGDHCYKQNKDLGPKEQMITALPDVRSILLTDEDEFMVLACDGIWNVMSSQDCVTFIKAELDSGTKQLSAICEKIFDHCLAPNTDGDGTGCDNMTCMIVTFKHASLDRAASAKRRASNGELHEEASDCKKSKQEEETSDN